jgi:hypothetical protein
LPTGTITPSDCPEGTWPAQARAETWGKSANLFLCFAHVETGKKYRLSVFSRTGYRPGDNSHDFRNAADPADLFELTTNKTKTRNPDLKSARKIGAQSEVA